MNSIASHLIKHFYCSFRVPVTNTKVNQTVVQNFIRLVSKVLWFSVHFPNNKKGSHYSSVRVTTNVIAVLIKVVSTWLHSLNKARKCVVVRLNPPIPHLSENAPCIIDPTTTNAYFNERVVCNLVWGDRLVNHKIKKIKRFTEELLDGTSFEQRVESDLVRPG